MFLMLDLVLQIFFPTLLVRSPKVVGLRILQHLYDDEKAYILKMGLIWLTNMPHIWENHKFLSALAKWWHNEHNIFHLSTSEATITLEDVYHILHVPCYAKPMSSYVLFLICF